ncbi:glycosyltransferase [Candidatus Bathyarchaeota archaeon]|nr:glycosyltransferase [Candidatus Bathyarchaeota archaeon]
MDISVVIPVLNSVSTIGGCIRSLKKQSISPYEIIVVDGGSNDGTIELLEKLDVDLITDRGETPGQARNTGMEKASGEVTMFCDSDCLAGNNLLYYHLKGYSDRDDISGVMGTIRNCYPGNPVAEYFQKLVLTSEWGSIKRDGTVNRLATANFSVIKEELEGLRFNESLTSVEDTELFYRLKRNQKKILYEPRGYVYHHNPDTIKKLYEKFKWYGRGIYQFYSLYGDGVLSEYQVYSPGRYLKYGLEELQEAVYTDNKLLCTGCQLNELQNCMIEDDIKLDQEELSNLYLHRVTCLGIATGIYEERKRIIE